MSSKEKSITEKIALYGEHAKGSRTLAKTVARTERLHQRQRLSDLRKKQSSCPMRDVYLRTHLWVNELSKRLWNVDISGGKQACKSEGIFESQIFERYRGRGVPLQKVTVPC